MKEDKIKEAGLSAGGVGPYSPLYLSKTSLFLGKNYLKVIRAIK